MTDRATWTSPWPAEDGGPERRQVPGGVAGWGLAPGAELVSISRMSIASTMVVVRDDGEVYLLCHTGGDDAVSWVERIDPATLAMVARSADLPGGRTWPGGVAVHANGDIYVAFGRHLHRLTPSLEVVASAEMPRDRPYNSFVVLPDGHLVTKDFAGATPLPPSIEPSRPSQLVVLDPDLHIVDTCELAEPSIARLSATGSTVVTVGAQSLMTHRWTGTSIEASLEMAYRRPGASYGWDAVIADGSAWFLDQGAGTERFAGSFVGLSANDGPTHLHRIDLTTGEACAVPVCEGGGGLVANPPAVDVGRRIVVGYDSSNAVVRAFRYGDMGEFETVWSVDLAHASHPLLFPDTGEIVLGDHDSARSADQLVVLDIETGTELARVDTGSPVQSVLFPAVGWDRSIYTCSLTTVSRIVVA